MADIKEKNLGFPPRLIKRLIKNAQSENVIITVDFGSSLSDVKERKQNGHDVTTPPEYTQETESLSNQEGHETQQAGKPFDLEAIYTERARKLAYEMVRGFQEGWSENSLSKREVCLNPQCLQLFWKKHDSQDFCSDECRDAVDTERSRAEMEERREAKERKQWAIKLLGGEETRFRTFESFLRVSRSKDMYRPTTIGALIRKQISGGWTTVNQWLSHKDPHTLWNNLPHEIQNKIINICRESGAC